ncbi:DUF4265 domain-containing protein [Streptomyces sp. JJ36]|uniref:DUF4265 domain-containing protein n=1 Tax=Streptomyces sp. JJ36 TaxID=2736645 RepID=UPI001F45A750|nr:DUF4265 domain-containing protein [Streptomyces sp. JJ36]MCF6526089.1 DUF4265 domain-containing protein [Streptomyces sp. JJ36]
MSSQVSFIVHNEPAVRPDQAYIAVVDLAPFGFSRQMEQIWLRPLNDREYEVCCLPFRVYGMAMGDVVSLDKEARSVNEIVRHSGNRVFRIFFPLSTPSKEFHSAKDDVTSAIRDADLQAEWSGDRHVAINIPLGGSVARVWEVVRELEGIAVWEWSDVEEFRTS